MVSTSAGSIPSLTSPQLLHIFTPMVSTSASSIPSLTSPQLLHIHRVHHELPVLLLLLSKVESVALVFRLGALPSIVLGAVVVDVRVVEAVQRVGTLCQPCLRMRRHALLQL